MPTHSSFPHEIEMTRKFIMVPREEPLQGPPKHVLDVKGEPYLSTAEVSGVPFPAWKDGAPNLTVGIRI